MRSIPASRAPSRTQIKAQLLASKAEAFAALPFQTHLLVVSTEHSSAQKPGCVSVARNRINQGKPGEYYFFVVYYNRSYDYQEYGFISFDSLKFLNPGDAVASWRVPLHVCTLESALFVESTPFRSYQEKIDSLPDYVMATDVEKALDLRQRLYSWFCMPQAYQDSHPLTDVERRLAAISSHEKVLDSFSYAILAYHATPNMLELWVAAETRLLAHKLLMRNVACKRICIEVRAPNLSLACAMEGLPEFHRRNQARISSSPNPMLAHSMWREMVNSFFTELARRQMIAREDVEAAEQVMPERLETIRQCAPKCMRQLLNQALGTVKEQASMSAFNRGHLSRYLLENELDVDDITQIMRPKCMIEYEMESKEDQAWSVATATIRGANAHRDQAITADEPEFFRSCHVTMDDGLCPFLQKAAPLTIGNHTTSQYYAARKACFKAAKIRCHEQLQTTWNARHERGLAEKQERVKNAWTMSPWCYTQVAEKGEKFNVDKKKEMAAKRKETMDNKPPAPKRAKQSKKKKKRGKDGAEVETEEQPAAQASPEPVSDESEAEARSEQEDD